MAINLTKGGRINLTKEAPSLTLVKFDLGWKENAFDTGADFDLDASAFVCKVDASGNSVLLGDDYMVFYNQLTDPSGAISHSGDNKIGGSDVCETITVDLAKLASDARVQNVGEISFIVTIHEAIERKQNFGQVSNSFISLRDGVTNKELARYDLEDSFSNETAVQFGSLVKKDGSWVFKAVGAGFNKGLADFVEVYGGHVAG